MTVVQHGTTLPSQLPCWLSMWTNVWWHETWTKKCCIVFLPRVNQYTLVRQPTRRRLSLQGLFMCVCVASCGGPGPDSPCCSFTSSHSPLRVTALYYTLDGDHMAHITSQWTQYTTGMYTSRSTHGRVFGVKALEESSPHTYLWTSAYTNVCTLKRGHEDTFWAECMITLLSIHPWKPQVGKSTVV